MRIWLFLRLILATVFALTAFIFSEVIPDVPPFSRIVLRLAVTVWFGLLGFGVFPDLAKRVTVYTISFMNQITEKVTSEVMNQIVRISNTSQQQPLRVAMTAPGPAMTGMTVQSPFIMDTSAIIDGRILDIAKLNFLNGLILVPSFVLEELQQVADSSDYLKRNRGRRGFEIVEEMKTVKNIKVEIWDRGMAGKQVDERLIKLAKSLHGKIITTDFNLNKVATLSNVIVLNVNDLANAVKLHALPGEEIEVKIIHLGKDPKQGIGYFPDGTMIVVEDGADLVGKQVKTEVTRVLQVAAGRMVFTKRV